MILIPQSLFTISQIHILQWSMCHLILHNDIMQHPAILHSSSTLASYISTDLCSFMLSQVAFVSMTFNLPKIPVMTYWYKWRMARNAMLLCWDPILGISIQLTALNFWLQIMYKRPQSVHPVGTGQGPSITVGPCYQTSRVWFGPIVSILTGLLSLSDLGWQLDNSWCSCLTFTLCDRDNRLTRWGFKAPVQDGGMVLTKCVS